jgi:CubicO group peptidase (beta-lactamase class C family)
MTSYSENHRYLNNACVKLAHLGVFAIVALPLMLAIQLRAQDSHAGSATPDTVEAYLQPLVDNHTLAGTVVLVATKDGTIYLQPTGFRNIATKAPMTPDAMFWIASVSKPIAATALMMLVDEGKVNVDDPVEKYLPEFKGQQVLATRPDPKQSAPQPPATVAANHPILVREILSHTSGLRFHSAAEPHALDLLPLKDAVRSYAAEPLLFQPYTDYSYANEGINTAARIIEVVSGMPYEQFLQERIFDPLGMKDTTFWPSPEQISRLAESYKLNPQTKALEAGPIDQLTYPLNDRQHRFPMPAGGLFSTASDLARFCQMILNGGTLGGKRYISPEALQMMTSKQTPVKDGYGFGWGTSADGFGHGGAYKNSIDINTTKGRILVFMVQQNGPWGTTDGDAIMPTLERLADAMVSSKSK